MTKYDFLAIAVFLVLVAMVIILCCRKTMTDFKTFNINYYVKFRLGEYVEKLQLLGFL